ncbi:MAG: TlpA disulfide reductase family protein [Planctomycetota bacterium]
MKTLVSFAALLVVLLSSLSCATSKGLPLYTMPTANHMATGGQMRVFPFFIDQPTVLAFWSPDSLPAIEDLTPLNSLAHRRGPVRLVGICSSPERARANKWITKERVVFEMIHDPERKLARRLGVTTYPTYVFFDRQGQEIARQLDVRTIHNWFDREHWWRKADPQPFERQQQVQTAGFRENGYYYEQVPYERHR